jgi:hypothetical protein
MIEALIASALRSLVLAAIVWVGLKALRLRNPHAELTAWTFVLVASLLMPVTTRVAAVALPPAAVIEPVENVLPLFAETRGARDRATVFADEGERPSPTVSEASARAAAGLGERSASFVSLGYGAVASVFLFRIVMGLLLTVRLARRAQPLGHSAAGHDIRVSPDISSPVTFGRIILLPQDYADWTRRKRLAVLAHEIAHARRGDFYVQIAALLNRAIFWFSPLSWWLQRRLSELAEAASDDAALVSIEDRALYAEILLEFSGGAPTHLALAMARPATVRARIERILAESALPKLLSRRARVILVTAMAPIALIAASPLAARAPPTVEKATAPAAPRLDAPIETAYEDRRVGAAVEAPAPTKAPEKLQIAAAPASQDAAETMIPPVAGDAHGLLLANMASLTASSAAAAPTLPQTDGAAHISPKIEPTLPRPARSKTDTVTNAPLPGKPTELAPVETSARATTDARPDICARRPFNNFSSNDPTGQKGLYICQAFDREYAVAQPVGRR